MKNLLDHLDTDIFPEAMIRSFVDWCVWEQARPALVVVLEATGLQDLVAEVKAAETFPALATVGEQAGNQVKDLRKNTGPLGLSTAEAAAFIVHKLAVAAQEDEWDPEGVAFFSAQVSGWSAFAESEFTDIQRKLAVSKKAQETQEQVLRELWQQYQE